ncbi:UNVERIFIED_CONTAM: hypothetical protein FKN15_045212 [Acipenser sinensis]
MSAEKHYNNTNHINTHITKDLFLSDIGISAVNGLANVYTNLEHICGAEVVPNSTKKAEEENRFRDCADVYHAGFNKSGVYNINVNNMSETKKVFCNMEAVGGGWTVIQHREDGSVDFQRTWKEYKMGFGSPSGEHWLGNEFVFLLTSQRQYSLRIELTDWDGTQAFSQYDRFYIGNEKHNYRIIVCHLTSKTLTLKSWWFDACGPSNLNGMYYKSGQNLGKLNGIKWHYFKGPSYSLRATAMMIRPLDF